MKGGREREREGKRKRKRKKKKKEMILEDILLYSQICVLLSCPQKGFFQSRWEQQQMGVEINSQTLHRESV